MRSSVERLFAVASLLAFAACTEAPLIEYQGTATSEANPDSASQLKITFWLQENDTSFSGYVRTGGPLTGHGSAYAWHERSALRMVTVSNRGDTVMWKSQSATDSIGGKYEFVGGPQTGAFGTWRAHVTRGPTASPATLRDGPVTAIPIGPTLACIAILTIFLAGARWVHRLPHPISTPPTGVLVGRDLDGIGGWLALFTVGQAVTAAVMLFQLPGARQTLFGASWELGRIAWIARPILIVEFVFHVGQIVFPALGVYLIAKRSTFTPRYYLVVLSCVAFFLVLDTAAASLFTAQLDSTFGPGWSSSDGSTRSELIRNARVAIWAAIWAGYWINSLRVRTTFGCDALDRPLSIPRAAEPLAATSSTPTNVV